MALDWAINNDADTACKSQNEDKYKCGTSYPHQFVADEHRLMMWKPDKSLQSLNQVWKFSV